MATFYVGQTSVVTDFDPTSDVLDLGPDSIHNQIPVDTADGLKFLHMFDAGKSLLLEGVSLGGLHPENFAPISDAHLQQDLSAALAWEDGTGLVRPNTVYVRSHEGGQEEIVDFDPATDKISFFYLSVRGDGGLNFAVEETAEGVRFYSPLTGQSMTLRGVSFSDLDSSHFEWRANQLEDGIAGRMGLSDEIDGFQYPSENVFSGKSVAMAGLVDRAPYHSQPEYTGTPIGSPTDGDDALRGDERDNVLEGLRGDDSLYGVGDDDTLFGGSGLDLLNGGANADTLFGGSLGDVLYGEGGRDRGYGLEGNDFIYGGTANDWLEGNQNSDELIGGSGDDVLNGGQENDVLHGQAGDDLAYGAADFDRLVGDGGSDTLLDGNARGLNFGGGGRDYLYGGNGDDTHYGGDGVDFLYGNADEDSLSGDTGNDRVRGDEGDDWAWGRDGRDHMSGGIGDDHLFGNRGLDVLLGNGGDDTLTGGRGQDSVFGGSGDDVLRVQDQSDLVFGETYDGGSGVDTMILGEGATIPAGVLVTNVEFFI